MHLWESKTYQLRLQKKKDTELYKPTLVESKNGKYFPAFVACIKVKLDSINQYL